MLPIFSKTRFYGSAQLVSTSESMEQLMNSSERKEHLMNSSERMERAVNGTMVNYHCQFNHEAYRISLSRQYVHQSRIPSGIFYSRWRQDGSFCPQQVVRASPPGTKREPIKMIT